ncbi:MAG: DUF4403 family protein [Bernardetiaceae bacterium]|nr:DUF4403 family protein [Bernardetiaceae bacterium]
MKSTKIYSTKAMPYLYMAFGIITAYFFFVGCTGTEVKESTAPEAFLPQPEVASSYIAAPLTFDLKEIEKKLNQEIPNPIYQDDSFENDNIKLKVVQDGKVKLQWKNNQLHYAVPLKVWFEGKFEKKIIGKIKARKKQKLDFALILFFRSKVDIDKNWKLITQTEFVSMEWTAKPTVSLGPIKISVASVAEKVLNDKQSDLENIIDKVAYNALDLGKIVGGIWEDMQKPILLDKKHTERVWLKINPYEVEASKIRCTDGRHLEVYVGMHSHLRTIVGEEPQDSIIALPNLIPKPNLAKDTFELHAVGEVFYATVNQILDKKLKGKKFDIPETSYKIRIKRLKVSGRGENVVINLTIGGDIEAHIKLLGKPQIDTLKKEITITSFDYELETETTLISMASYALRTTIIEEVQTALHFPFEEHIEKIPQLIQDGLSKGNVGEKLNINLRAFLLEPQQVHVSKDALRVYARVRGGASFDVRNLNK